MTKRIVGIALFLAAVVIAIVAAFFEGDQNKDPLGNLVHNINPSKETVLAFVGGEKRLFVESPAVRDRLADDHGIVIDARRAGSIEMVTERAILDQKPDLLWPGSEIAAQIGLQNGLKAVRQDIIFSTPIVFFSWSPVADALVKQGVAQPLGNSPTTYTVNTKALLEIIANKKRWEDLGLPQIYGTVMVFATDPAHSNSGNQFAALMTMIFAKDQRDPAAIRAAFPRTVEVFHRMGYMERSSFDLFEQYLRTGMTAKPIIAGYENQLIEFAYANSNIWKTVDKQAVRPVILYPQPTVYSSHLALALTEKGARAIDALRDPKVLALAWSQHGFRAGFAGTADPNDLPIQGIPAVVPQVIPSLQVDLTEEMVEAIAGKASSPSK